jgi:hypothetical protein
MTVVYAASALHPVVLQAAMHEHLSHYSDGHAPTPTVTRNPARPQRTIASPTTCMGDRVPRMSLKHRFIGVVLVLFAGRYHSCAHAWPRHSTTLRRFSYNSHCHGVRAKHCAARERPSSPFFAVGSSCDRLHGATNIRLPEGTTGPL